MENPKYVIVEDMGLELPIVFSPILSHFDVVNHLKNFKGCKVVSAGECTPRCLKGDNTRTWGCWGQSVTLKIKSRNEIDEEILDKHFNLHSSD